jgi:hypothetical protein
MSDFVRWLTGGDHTDTLTAVGLGAISNSGLVPTGEHTWRNAASTVYCTRVVISPTRADLAIDVAGTGAQARGTITVQHWQEGQLGLSLGGQAQSTGVRTLSGDNDFTDRGSSQGVPLAATAVHAQGGCDVLRAGSSDADTQGLQLCGEQGNDIVFGNAGNDVIDGSEGNDFVSPDFYNVRIRELRAGNETNRPSDEAIWAQEEPGWSWRHTATELGGRLQYIEHKDSIVCFRPVHARTLHDVVAIQSRRHA